MKQRNRVAPAMLAAFALLLAACGGESNTAAAGDGEFESPLAEYMGFEDSFDPDKAEAQFAEDQRRISEEIVACMNAEGFEHIPEDDGAMISFEEEMTTDGLEWGSDEWTAKYGFGISTQSFSQEMVGPELVGFDDAMMMEEEGEYVDPNGEYVDSLSEADREAYYAALHGDDDRGPEISEDMSDEEMEAAYEAWEKDREPSGCMEKAWGDGGFGGPDEAFWEEFGDELQTMWERVESHPKIVAAEQETAECVAGKGFTYTTMQAVHEDFNDRMEQLYDSAYNFTGPELSDEEMASMTDQELDEFYGQPEMSAESKQELAEIQTEEIEMAVAVNECGGGFAANEDVYREVSLEIEQEFVEANKDRLDAYKAEQD